jgi:hypothetical protein
MSTNDAMAWHGDAEYGFVAVAGHRVYCIERHRPNERVHLGDGYRVHYTEHVGADDALLLAMLRQPSVGNLRRFMRRHCHDKDRLTRKVSAASAAEAKALAAQHHAKHLWVQP